MFEHGLSIDRVAWYLLMNTKIPNWEQAKQVAREMRDDFDEQKNDRNENENDSLEKGVKRTKDKIARED